MFGVSAVRERTELCELRKFSGDLSGKLVLEQEQLPEPRQISYAAGDGSVESVLIQEERFEFRQST